MSRSASLRSRPNPDAGEARRLARAAGVSAIGGVLIASLALAPHPFGVVAGALALLLPGWSVLTALMPDRQQDRLAQTVTSILVSVIVLIAVCLLLNVLGVRIETRSVGLSVLVFELLVAVSLIIRSRRSGPIPTTATVLAPPLEKDIPDEVAGRQSVRRATLSWLIGLTTLGALVAGVALVHNAAPTPVEPSYGSIAFAPDNGSPAKIIHLSPGPFTMLVDVGGNHALVGSMNVVLDGSVILGPLPKNLHPPVTLRLTAPIPAIDGCRHQLSVQLRSSGSTLQVIRYITGPVGTSCGR